MTYLEFLGTERQRSAALEAAAQRRLLAGGGVSGGVLVQLS
jgi:hypothetical protein